MKNKIQFSKSAVKFTEAQLNKYPIHEILWIDASGNSNWMSLHTESDPVYCISVGYIIGGDELRLIMAASLNSTGEKADVLYIPRGCVLKKRKIYPQRRKRGKANETKSNR